MGEKEPSQTGKLGDASKTSRIKLTNTSKKGKNFNDGETAVIKIVLVGKRGKTEIDELEFMGKGIFENAVYGYGF